MSVRPRGPLPNWRPTTPRQIGILADLIARYAQRKREPDGVDLEVESAYDGLRLISLNPIEASRLIQAIDAALAGPPARSA
jgi:hypothetical protein